MSAKYKILSVLFTVLLALAGCRRTDVRDFTVEIPQAAESDVPAITASLGAFAGVEKSSIRFDAARHVLTLKYDSMQVAKKNIEMAIAKAGFTANGVSPESLGTRPAKK